MEQRTLQLSGGGGQDKKSPLISEEEAKIRQDKLDTEKITSFVSIGGDSGRGVSIRFSERSEPRKDETASSPGGGGSLSECLQSQLAAVKLKLEQKRKKIEEDKRKVEVMMSKQREKVGQEAFLRAVAKGMEKSPKEGGQSDVDQERKPFILKEASPVAKSGNAEAESNTLDLYQLQKGLQRPPEPFYISQPPVTPPSQQVGPPGAPGAPGPYYMYPGHPPPPWYGMIPYHQPYYHPPHLLPHQLQADKPQPLTDKPSLSTSFLEMKRRQYQSESPSHHQRLLATSPSHHQRLLETSPSHHQRVLEASPAHHQRVIESSPRPRSPPNQQKGRPALSPRPASPSSPVKQSLSSSFLRNKAESQSPACSESPAHHNGRTGNSEVKEREELLQSDSTDNAGQAIEMTQSTLETLNSMTTESINKSDEDLSKGFVISFDAPVKPKPALKARQASVSKVEKEVKEVKEVVVLSPSCDRQCRVCGVRSPGEASATCRLCELLLERLREDPSPGPPCLTGSNSCQFRAADPDSWCLRCWRVSASTAGLLRRISSEEEESQRQKDWVVMMTEKRRQQAEENRIRREEEALRRREEEIAKREELIRKKDEDKKRREAIFEAYKTKKEADKLKEEGMNFFSSRPPPKLRPKSAGGGRMKPRPNTIHVDNRENDVSGSQNNISLYRSLGRGEQTYRRGSNVSLHDGGWSSGGSDIKSLSMFSRSKSSSASNLGPASLQLGVRGRHRQEDDNCSEISSTTSGYTSGRGSARLYREPVSKTNRPIIMNAVEYVVLPGAVNKETRRRVMEEIEKCDCPHFLILFRDSKLQFRALYAFYPDTEEVFKIHGVGPRQVTDSMMDSYFKYNSGGKKFTQIHTKHLTVTIDAFTIHNSLWLGKKTKLPDKEMALVV